MLKQMLPLEKQSSGTSRRASPPERRKQGRRIRIGGTLLAFFRERTDHGQQSLANAIGCEDGEHVSHCEEGRCPSLNLIQPKIGLIADALDLTGQEIKNLRGAADADDFLLEILKPAHSERPPKDQCLDFQLTVTAPASEMRHWLRIVFWDNCIDPEKKRIFDSSNKDGKKKIAPPDARLLVEAGALKEIRARIKDILKTAEENRVSLEERLHVLLFFARSARNSEPSRSEAITSLKTAIKGPPSSLLTRHLLAYALCELGEHTFMCEYLKQTEERGKEREQDKETNIRFMRRIAADNGDGCRDP
jgi:hypothetical protein